MTRKRRHGRSLAKKDTGAYAVELVDLGDTGEEYVLCVAYLGEWASGEPVEPPHVGAR